MGLRASKVPRLLVCALGPGRLCSGTSMPAGPTAFPFRRPPTVGCLPCCAASAAEAPKPNAIFDESGNFLLYPTLLGIKVGAGLLSQRGRFTACSGSGLPARGSARSTACNGEPAASPRPCRPRAQLQRPPMCPPDGPFLLRVSEAAPVGTTALALPCCNAVVCRQVAFTC